MDEKPSLWADWLLTFWVIVVGVFYFGGYFQPSTVGRYTVSGAVLYALMLLIVVGTQAARFLRRADKNSELEKRDASAKPGKSTHTKTRK